MSGREMYEARRRPGDPDWEQLPSFLWGGYNDRARNGDPVQPTLRERLCRALAIARGLQPDLPMFHHRGDVDRRGVPWSDDFTAGGGQSHFAWRGFEGDVDAVIDQLADTREGDLVTEIGDDYYRRNKI